MAKQTKPNLILAILAIAALIAVAAYSTDMLPLTTVGGMTIKSITTSPSIITESTNLQQAKFIIDASIDAGGDSIVATVYPSKFEAETGLETERSLSIRASAVDETFTYPIISTGRELYKYSAAMVDPGTCSSGADWTIPVYFDWWLYKDYHLHDICVYKEDHGVVGDIGSPANRFSVDLTMTVDGEAITKTIDSSAATTSVDFYDRYNVWRANALWYGNLLSGDAPPSAAPYRAIFIETAQYGSDWQNKWVISHWSEYEKYNDAENEAETRLNLYKAHPGSFECPGDVNTCLDVINTLIEPVNTAKTNFFVGSEAQIGEAIGVPQTVENRDNINAGKVIIKLDRTIVAHPQVRFMINADWVGVKIEVGKPEIISVKSECFASGDNTGIIEVTVKNVGTSSGTFIPQFADCYPFTPFGTPQKITFDPGETGTMYVNVQHGTYAQDIEKRCPVSVCDVSDSSRCDSASVLMCMTQPRLCAAGTCEQTGQCVSKCKPDGSGMGDPYCCGDRETMDRDPGLDNEFCGYYCDPWDDDEPDPEVIECQAECDDKYAVWDVLNRAICYATCWFEANKDKMLLIGIAAVILILLLFRTVFRMSPAGRALQYARPPPRY